MRFIVATASTGYLPAADSADSITASAPSNTAVETSDTSARVGTGLWIIDSSICVATTTGLPARRAIRVICFCRPGTRSTGISTPRSPRATISASADIDDFGQAFDGLGFLDLGHHRGAAAHELLGLDDVFGPLHERQRDPVDARDERGFEVSAILRRHRRDRQIGVGQADALAVGNAPADRNAGDDAVRRCLLGDQADLAVIDQQRMAGSSAQQGFRDAAAARALACRAPDRRRARSCRHC